MNIIIDLAVVLIIGLFVFLSAKKGFVKSVVETVGFVAAIVIAFSFSGTISEWGYNTFIEPSIIEMVDEQAKDLPSGAEVSVSLDKLPDFVVKNAEKFGLSLDEFSAVNGEEIVANGVETVKETVIGIVKPVSTKIISAVAFVILAVVLVIVANFLAKVINKLFSFSVIGTVNRVLGGILGAVKGLAIATVICMLIAFLAGLGGGFLIFTDEVINSTFLFKTLANIFTF